MQQATAFRVLVLYGLTHGAPVRKYMWKQRTDSLKCQGN